LRAAGFLASALRVAGFVVSACGLEIISPKAATGTTNHAIPFFIRTSVKYVPCSDGCQAHPLFG
jgi:hypothetical protein